MTALRNQSLAPHEVCWVHDAERRGAAWARNRGIERTTAEIIAFIDDDCLPPDNWLWSLREAMDRFSADIAGGTYEETDPFLAARRARQSYPEVTGPDSTGAVGAGGNIAITRSALEALRQKRGFVYNETFRISQDWELAWRLHEIGSRAVFSTVRVRHLKSLKPTQYLRQQFSRGIGIAMLNDIQKLMMAVPLHNSRLWGTSDHRGTTYRVIQLLFYKGLGPFDYYSFPGLSDFLLFWLGEKLQGAGFVWYVITGRIKAGQGGDNGT